MQNPAHGNVMSENTQSERNLYCFVFKLYFKRFNIITEANIYVRVYGIIWFDLIWLSATGNDLLCLNTLM